MRWYILVVSLSVVSCRPQQQQSVFTHQDASKPTVEYLRSINTDFQAERNQQQLSPIHKQALELLHLIGHYQKQEVLNDMNDKQPNYNINPQFEYHANSTENKFHDNKPVENKIKEENIPLKVDNDIVSNVEGNSGESLKFKSEKLSLRPRENLIVDPDTLAPYRAHPLFYYLKNRNTIDTDKIISFRNEDQTNRKTTTLILKPVARAVAGVEGKAMSTPISKAVLRKGMNVDVLFEPDAFAIVGPGGVAHAESTLEISYDEI